LPQVVYSTKSLHSGSLDFAAWSKLSCDPGAGRLTANMFLF